jgi:hypothetical protein
MEDFPRNNRSAAKVGRELGITERVAQRWWKNYLETGELPFQKKQTVLQAVQLYSQINMLWA